MANITIDLKFSNNTVPNTMGGIKRVVSTSALTPYKYIEEYTVQGQLLALNNNYFQGDEASIWTLVDSLSDKLKNELGGITIIINNQTFSNVYRVNSINFDRPNSNDQDVLTKQFSISFERHVGVSNSILSTYGISDLEKIESINFSISKEDTLNSKVLIKNISVQYTTLYTGNVCDSVPSITTALLTSLTALYPGLTKGRIFRSQTCDASNKSFDYQERQVTFLKDTDDYPTFFGYSLDIGGNGTFSITENGNVQANKEAGVNIASFKTHIDSLIGQAFNRCANFVAGYYSKLNLLSNLAPKISVQNLPLNSSINIDNSNLSANYSITYSNDPRNSVDTIINITEEISTNAYKDAKVKTERGSIKGMGITDHSTTNSKFTKAKNKYENLYSSKISSAFSLTNQSSMINGAKYPTYLTNANITYNFSEGAIEFSHTYESDRTFDSGDNAFVSVFVNVTKRGPLHLTNSYLIFGGKTEGKELVIDSQQGVENITSLEVQFILKPSTKSSDCVKKFKSYIDKIKVSKGFLKSARYSFDPVGRTFSGSAEFLSFDSYRELKDINPKAEVKDVTS